MTSSISKLSLSSTIPLPEKSTLMPCMNDPEPEVSIVMPCLNEAESLEACIKEAIAAIKLSGTTGEVVIADNGSTDESVKIALSAGARVVHVEQKGYGNALQGGINEARGTFVLMGDADGSYDFRELPEFLKLLRDGCDLVMGCRLPKGGGTIEKGAMPWKHRWIGNPVLSGLGKLFFASPVVDFHCGLRAFRREAILNLDLKTPGMEYASEMVIKAQLQFLKIGQIPITLRCDKRTSPPHLRSFRDGWRHLRFMLLYTPKWLFVFPGLILFLTGLAGSLILLPKPLTISGVTLDLNTLLVSSTAMLVGFQLCFFGIFTKAYGVSIGLLPGKDYWLKLINGKSVEIGIIAGFIIILTGAAILGYALIGWKNAGFGELSYQESLRQVIPAVTCLGLGIQTVVSGFALAILGLKK
ncbi:Glycosyl transferase family 2 [Desulfamplus magnetovallimortis]|uniref:Glycosyl transferase family 2 n=1 Tax=Desulfamplus magnetovallimortis TaxID=1246637 RepID=A0A1W1HBZ4_9BACT|nr:glycosyltransferase family 2 protein [Desulfamplus magnetovallimortis]SLM29956.1 Glycosyl transferase family 2 [Desulfamplus magnetovallimortis]